MPTVGLRDGTTPFPVTLGLVVFDPLLLGTCVPPMSVVVPTVPVVPVSTYWCPWRPRPVTQ